MYKIISKPNCSFCDKAKMLLRSKGIAYEEVVLNVGQTLVEGVNYISLTEFQQLAPGAKTVPQIFVNGVLIGGFNELAKSI